MFASSFNAFLYTLVLLFYWYKHKRIDVFFCIAATYMAVAWIGVALIGTGMKSYNQSMINYLYLFICVMLFIRPFKYAQFNSHNISVSETNLVKGLLIVYFVSGIVALWFTLPKTIALAALGEWDTVRNQLYTDPDSIQLYESQFERLAKNTYSYLSPFGLVIAVYQLTKEKFNIWYTLAIFLVWLSNSYCSATLVASRGMIVIMAVKIVIVYLIFKASIPQKRKKYIFVCAVGVIVFFAGYMIAVSESRFGNDAGDSVFVYLGHSMPTFNQDIMFKLHDYGYGKYFFKWLYEAFGISADLDLAKLGCKHNTAFITFVGCFYVDFGPIFTIVVAFLTASLLSRFTRQKRYLLSDLVVIAFFADWFINGVFVVGRSQSLQWLMLFVVYYIVHKIETRRVVLI